MTPRLISAAATTLLLATSLLAQTPPHPQPTSAAISPDGTTVAWTLKQGETSTLHLTTLAAKCRLPRRGITGRKA